MLKLSLDEKNIKKCCEFADSITSHVTEQVSPYSTTAIERTVARFSGVDGVDSNGVPLANVLVEHLVKTGKIGDGVSVHLANACLEFGKKPREIAQMVSEGKLNMSNLNWHDTSRVISCAEQNCLSSLNLIKVKRHEREELTKSLPAVQKPYLYVICATGNIYEDVVQAKMAASQGADIIAVIRSTGQSLLDYVPHGPTVQGFGGTYATQANFKLMRKALDEQSQKLGRYIKLVNYCSGLCMPEIAFMGAVERLDMMLNDAMYGILFRDINMLRTLVDQNFSRMINAYAGVIINTGEDNYLTTAEGLHAGPSVLASQFINYFFAKKAGLKDEFIGLGHAFEIDPSITDSLSYELAMALLVRHIFPNCPVKYMPPTVHKTGDIFQSHILDSSFNFVSVLTGQTIHLVGMLTEAIHTPFVQDRYLSLKSAKYMRSAAKNLSQSFRIQRGSFVDAQAKKVLDDTVELLEQINSEGLFDAISQGIFAGVKRQSSGGKGKEGVFEKSEWYFNPVENVLQAELF